MASNDEILQNVILGIPRVAKRIVELPEQQREKAIAAVEQTYLHTAMDLDYAEVDARDWVTSIIDCLRAEVDERVRRETQVTDYDGFASLERTLGLLARTAN
jgi:hypothetical protein